MLRIVSIRVRPRNVYAERGTKLEITGVNELEAVTGNLTVRVLASHGPVAFAKTIQVRLGPGIAQLFNERLDTSTLRGTYTLEAEITANDGSPVTANEYNFDVFTASTMLVRYLNLDIRDCCKTRA